MLARAHPYLGARSFLFVGCGSEPSEPWPEADPHAGFEIRGTVMRIDAEDTSILPEQRACVDCEVRLVPQDDDNAGPGPDRIVETDARGRYRAIGVPRGSYHVIASSPDGFFGSAPNGAGSSGTAGMTYADVTVRNGGLIVSGVVRDAAGPVADAHVAIARREVVRDVAPYQPRVHTDANGAFRIGGIVPVVSTGEREETLRVCASSGAQRACVEVVAAPLSAGEARELTVDVTLVE